MIRKRQDQRGRGTQAPLRYIVAVQPPAVGVEYPIARARDREAAVEYARKAAEIYGWPAIVQDSVTGELIPIERGAQGGAQ